MVYFTDENLGKVASQGVILIYKLYSLHAMIESMSDLDSNGASEVLLTSSYAASRYLTSNSHAFSIGKNARVVEIYQGEEINDNTASGMCEEIKCSKTEESYSFADTNSDGIKEMIVSRATKSNQNLTVKKALKFINL